MKISALATKFGAIWGASATSTDLTQPIPAAASSTTGRAGFDVGFPSVNFVSEAAGGIPPWGADWNGVLYMLSAAAQDSQAGVLPPFDATFATNIGGYPKNAIIADATTTDLFWVSTADNNTTVPGASGATWTRVDLSFTPVQQGGGTGQGANKIYLGLRTGLATGATSRVAITVDSSDLGNIATVGAGHLGQGSWMEKYSTLDSSTSSETISLSFTAPFDGDVIVMASANLAAQSTGNNLLSVALDGTTGSSDSVANTTAMTNHSCFSVTAGAHTVSSYFGISSTTAVTVGHTLSYLFVPS